MSSRSPVSRSRLLMGVSATALILSGAQAYADTTNPFARVSNPAAVVAQTAANQLSQTNVATAAAQLALAAFQQASAIRANIDNIQVGARAALAAAQNSMTNGLGAGGLQPAA